jgi:hypothetical protein
MLVTIVPHRIGYYTAYPVSEKWAHKFAAHMHDMTGKATTDAFFQSTDDFPDTVTQHRHFRDLEQGWTLTIQVDPWEYGHWLGYDAHTVAER